MNNQRRFASNFANFNAAHTASDFSHPLYPILKEQAGFGDPLPDIPAIPPGVLPAVAPAIGTPIGAPFPADVYALRNLTHVDINVLSILYNDTFGIIGVDNAQTRRDKFSRWITGRC